MRIATLLLLALPVFFSAHRKEHLREFHGEEVSYRFHIEDIHSSDDISGGG